MHHVALLIGYGAAAVNPYLAFESIEDLVATGRDPGGVDRRTRRSPELRQGAEQGRAEGDVQDGHLDDRVLHRCAGVRGVRAVQRGGRRVLRRHAVAARRRRARRARRGGRRPARKPRTRSSPTSRAHRRLDVGGEYQWRREGELHLFNPETVFLLQHATRRAALRGVPRVHREGRAAQPRGRHPARAVRVPKHERAAGADRRGRAGRARSSRASPPARCPTARSRPRRTRRSRSR